MNQGTNFDSGNFVSDARAGDFRYDRELNKLTIWDFHRTSSFLAEAFKINSLFDKGNVSEKRSLLENSKVHHIEIFGSLHES